MNPTTSKEDVKKEIRTKIVALLGNADFSFDKNVATSVDLMINRKGQVVVLDVHSTNSNVVNYLNLKELSLGGSLFFTLCKIQNYHIRF